MHSIIQWFIPEVVPAFSRTLVHSLWQGLVAAILAGIVIAFTRRSPAAKRYNGLVAVYALFLITVATTFFYEMDSSVASEKSSVSIVGLAPSIISVENGIPANEVIKESFGNSILLIVNRNAALLAGLWAFLFLTQLTRMAFGLRYVQSIRRLGTQPAADEWNDWLRRISYQLGIRQTVLLQQSERIKVPVAIGILKPVILVPIGLINGLTSQQVEAILLHELAHIRRKDYLVNLVQSFTDAVFFFNPAVRWISARIREERETCCDNMVVQHTANKKEYVEALVSFSQLSLSSSYAMAIGSNKKHLLNRVKTIISRENSRLTKKEQTVLVLGMMAMIAFGTFAFKPKEKEIKKETPIEKKTPPEIKNIISSIPTETLKKTIVTVATNHSVDTLPPSTKIKEPIKWKSTSTNTNDDGMGKTMEVLATTEDGTVYKFKKIDNEIVSLSVNGSEIAKQNYSQYYPIVDALEQARKQKAEDVVKAHEVHETALKQEGEMLMQKLKTIDEKNSKALQEEKETLHRKLYAINESRKKNLDENQEALRHHLESIEQKKHLYHADSLNNLKHLIEYEQKQQNYNEKQQHYNEKLKLYNENQQLFKQHKSNLVTNSNISAIISELLANKLADNETKLSFSLNNNAMAVNGKAVDNNLFEIFRKKYIKSSGDSYSYSRDGGSTSTTINIQ